jgi:hypothetical protein
VGAAAVRGQLNAAGPFGHEWCVSMPSSASTSRKTA